MEIDKMAGKEGQQNPEYSASDFNLDFSKRDLNDSEFIKAAEPEKIESRHVLMSIPDFMYRDILINSKTGIWKYDSESGDVFWSKETYDLFQFDYSVNVPSFKEHIELIIPEDRELFINSISNALEYGKSYNIIVRVKSRDGRIRFLNSMCYPKGNFRHKQIWGLVRDITELKNAEMFMNESEKKFLAIFKNSNVAMALSQRGKLLVSNNFCSELFGYNSSDELTGKSIPDLFANHEKDRIREIIEKRARGEKAPDAFEAMALKKDGTEFYADFKISSYFQDSEYFHITVIRDISDQKKYQTELTESENKYRSLVENMLEGLLVVDNDDKIIFANQTFCTMLGYELAEIVGKIGYDFLLAPRDKQMIIEKNKQREQGLSEQYELTMYKKTGEPIVLWMNASPLVDFSKNFKGSMATCIDITEKKIIDEALAQRNYWLHESQKIGRIGSYVLDIKTGNWSSTDILDEIFGIEKNYQKSIDGWLNIVHPDDREKMSIYYLYNVVGEKEPFNKEYRIKKVDTGESRWVWGLGQLTFDENGAPEKMLGTIQDITERMNYETALRKSEIRYRRIIANSHAGYFFINKNGIFTDVNDAWLKLYKYDSKEEIIGKPFSAFQKQDDVDASQIIVNLILAGKKDGLTGEFSRLCKDGSVGYHNFSIKPVLENDEIIGLDGFLIDITDRRHAELALTDSEQKFRTMFENMYEGVAIHEMIKNSDGEFINYRIIDANPAFENHTSIKITQALNSLSTDLYQTPNPPYLDIYSKAVKEHESISFETFFPPMNKYFNIRVVPIDSKRFSTVFEDVTKRKQNEQDLINAKKKAEESDMLKSAFLANMSHEIRTPLNAILGFTELMKDSDITPDEKEEYYKIIKTKAYDLLNIINDILDFSKLEAGQVTIIESRIKLNEMLKDLFTTFSFSPSERKEKNITLVCNNELESNNFEINTDSQKLKQILTNLIGNAFKFTELGEIEFGCKLSDEDFLLFYVRDTGIGIPVDQQEIIFERFHQINDIKKSKNKGTGLGLSISKGFVELLGGRIWVESKLDSGTTFYFTIPFKPVIKSKTGTIPEKSKDKVNLDGYTILIVEDDNYNLLFLEMLLKTYGAKFYSAKSGENAIELFIALNDIDLVLMDVGLPDISGIEVTRTLKSIKPEIPVIIQTGYSMEEDKIKSLEAGCDDFISKPVLSNDLIEKISKLLD